MSNIYLDRGEASKILKVSTRTLDRYIRKYKIKVKKKGRKVLIRRTDVDKIINDHVGHFIKDFTQLKIKKNTDKLDINVDKVDSVSKKEDKVSNKAPESGILSVKDVKVKSVKKALEAEETVYKELYLETKKELKDRQDRLEAATYRVGQLESQLKSTVPLLDYNRKARELKEAQTAMEQRELESQTLIHAMENKIRSERVAKWIYLSLVGLLLIAEPILFMLWAFN